MYYIWYINCGLFHHKIQFQNLLNQFSYPQNSYSNFLYLFDSICTFWFQSNLCLRILLYFSSNSLLVHRCRRQAQPVQHWRLSLSFTWQLHLLLGCIRCPCLGESPPAYLTRPSASSSPTVLCYQCSALRCPYSLELQVSTVYKWTENGERFFQQMGALHSSGNLAVGTPLLSGREFSTTGIHSKKRSEHSKYYLLFSKELLALGCNKRTPNTLTH